MAGLRTLGEVMAEASQELAAIGIRLDVLSEGECFGLALREAILDRLIEARERLNQRGRQ